MTKFKKVFTRTVAVAFTVFAIATFSQTADACTYPIRGDVNDDGCVNVYDTLVLRKYVLGIGRDSIPLEYADVERDGVINNADLTALQKITLGDDYSYFVVNGRDRTINENQIFLDNGKYYGILQTDGNVVIYRRDSGKNTAVFNTGTHVNASSYKNHRLVFQADGNIVLYATQKSNGKNVVRWQTKTYLGKDGMYMAYLNKNGLLEWTTKDRMVWSTDSKFTTNESQRAKKRVESGYEYSTCQNAAIDFIFAYGSKSVSENREYGAVIDREGDIYKLYWRTLYGPQRIPGDIEGEGPELFFTTDSVAYVHTHGKEVGWENDRFSNEDINIAVKRNCVAYLGAPNGQIRVFEPGKDPINDRFQSGRVISENAPH